MHSIAGRTPVAIGLSNNRREFVYTPMTSFETFPFPEPTAAQREAIAEAARELDEIRRARLNPPEWTHEEILEFPGSVDGRWGGY